MEDNKALCREFLHAVGRGDIGGVSSRMTDDFILNTKGTSLFSGQRDRATTIMMVGMIAQATVDGVTLDIETMTAEQDRVSVEMTGTSALANGGEYNNTYHILFRVRDGKIAVMNEYIDTKYIDQSLGGAIIGAMLTH